MVVRLGGRVVRWSGGQVVGLLGDQVVTSSACEIIITRVKVHFVDVF